MNTRSSSAKSKYKGRRPYSFHNGEAESKHIEIERSLTCLIDRRTSPYFTDDPYALLGEFLILDFKCRFIRFERIGKDPIYVGISSEERQWLSKGAMENLTDEGTIRVRFKRERTIIPVKYKKISLSTLDFTKVIQNTKDKQYWVKGLEEECLDEELQGYIDTLEQEIKAIVLFWKPSKKKEENPNINLIVEEFLPKALFCAFPRSWDKSKSLETPRFPIDHIDIMRWFTSRFENWYLQPNEQFGFVVFEKPKNYDSKDERIGEELGFKKGWLQYKYTGNFFLRSSPVLRNIVERINTYFHSYGTLETKENVAKGIMTLFLKELVEELKSEVNRQKLQEAEDIFKALDKLQKHLSDNISKVIDRLQKKDYNHELVKPILSMDFEDTKKNDKTEIQKLLRIAGLEDSSDEILDVVFYTNLLMRRVLLDIPQSMDVGFATYFMETGIAEPIRDVRRYTPRRQTEVKRTSVSTVDNAIYTVLGRIESLFGLGGEENWTSYVAAAPLYGNGQRLGFIFVSGYYSKEWVRLRKDEHQRNKRLQYISRLLRTNAPYAGKVLQEAYDRKFRSNLASFIRDISGDFRDGLRDNLYHLLNLDRPAKIEIVESSDAKMEISSNNGGITIVLHIPSADGKCLKLEASLLEGENRIFVEGGSFDFRCTLDDADTFRLLADVVSLRTKDAEFKKIMSETSHSQRNINQGTILRLRSLEQQIKGTGNDRLIQQFEQLRYYLEKVVFQRSTFIQGIFEKTDATDAARYKGVDDTFALDEVVLDSFKTALAAFVTRTDKDVEEAWQRIRRASGKTIGEMKQKVGSTLVLYGGKLDSKEPEVPGLFNVFNQLFTDCVTINYTDELIKFGLSVRVNTYLKSTLQIIFEELFLNAFKHTAYGKDCQLDVKVFVDDNLSLSKVRIRFENPKCLGDNNQSNKEPQGIQLIKRIADVHQIEWLEPRASQTHICELALPHEYFLWKEYVSNGDIPDENA